MRGTEYGMRDNTQRGETVGGYGKHAGFVEHGRGYVT